ncbi:PilW family protein [Bacillus sp. USDA818B3_A]|uniref:PilW family protein n=1 Tax=Bacillus sp. USDA818B3_A TaxID=2698834 RepID=UPI0013714984|nr:prepilin-type N-terminal cleavage/methylation domain-containing protein [Bacillus sp. USDA818B3_A]
MKKENGLTLIEVLATLTILFIITSVIYSVFFGVNKNYIKISQKNKEEQQVNLIFSTIKSYHTKNVIYELKYFDNTANGVDDGSYFIGAPSASNQLGDDQIEYIYLYNYKDNKIIKIFDKVTKSVSINTSQTEYKSVKVTLKFKGQEKEYDTFIKRY